MEKSADKWLATKFVEWCLKKIGRPINSPATVKFYVLFFIHIMLLVQITILQVLPWKDINARFLALEGFNVVTLVVICFFELGVCIDKIKNLLNIFKDSEIYNRLPLSAKQKAILEDHAMNEKATVRRLALICYAYVVTNILPCLYGIYEINLTDLEGISEQDILTPFKCWYPFSIKTNFNYVMAVIPQILCRYFSTFVYLIWIATCFGRLETICTEIRMLTSFVLEIDERLGESPAETNLKIYVSHLVNHHVSIQQSVKIFNRSSSTFLFAINQVQIFELCIAIYCLSEDTGMSLKMLYLSMLGCLLFLMNIMCNFGQLLTDEGDYLRLALEKASWIDKSISYKKSLLIMITSAHKPLQVVPAGLFVLNKRHITLILQAGYSCLNLMKHLKKQ